MIDPGDKRSLCIQAGLNRREASSLVAGREGVGVRRDGTGRNGTGRDGTGQSVNGKVKVNRSFICPN